MSHGKHFDFIAADSIDQAEGEARKYIAVSVCTIPGPAFRTFGHRIDGTARFIAKATRSY
jgi:hypothetical protein